MSDHTPGPWSLKAYGTISGGEVSASDGTHVATVYSHQPRDNGPLIAAAPAMLEALEWIAECMEDSPEGSFANMAWGKARAAILQAKGEAKS